MKKAVHTCEPAHSIIEAFGGAKALAQLLNISANSPTAWRAKKIYRKDGNIWGSDGQIPHKYWVRIIQIAKLKNIDVFIDVGTTDEPVMPQLNIKK